jgi:hypothetical protein
MPLSMPENTPPPPSQNLGAGKIHIDENLLKQDHQAGALTGIGSAAELPREDAGSNDTGWIGISALSTLESADQDKEQVYGNVEDQIGALAASLSRLELSYWKGVVSLL